MAKLPSRRADEEVDSDSDVDMDPAARKERSFAYAKRALTAQPLDGNTESDDDDDDMEVGPSQAFVVTHLMPCI